MRRTSSNCWYSLKSPAISGVAMPLGDLLRACRDGAAVALRVAGEDGGFVAQAREERRATLRHLGLIERHELGLDVLVLADHTLEQALVLLEQPPRVRLPRLERGPLFLECPLLLVAPRRHLFEAGDERGWNRGSHGLSRAPLSCDRRAARVYRAAAGRPPRRGSLAPR